jgi:hypothetical protein
MPAPNPSDERSYQQDRRDDRQNRRDDQDNVVAEIARTDERVNALERWQVAQNGSLGRIEAKLDAHQASTNAKFDGQSKWMLSSLVTAVIALATLVVTFLHK